jgi:hypothetical protein
MSTRAFQVHANDNVATLIDDVRADDAVQVIGPGATTLTARDAITSGHKIALVDITSGAAVRKFGVIIGTATVDIRRGSWVHLHNIRSNFDQRSQTLDVHSGATTDTKYE